MTIKRDFYLVIHSSEKWDIYIGVTICFQQLGSNRLLGDVFPLPGFVII